MPTYDYYCERCGSFEFQQRITEPALTRCPRCGGEVKRLVSRNVNIVFKGSGFYVTDNRSSSAASSSGNDKAETSSTSDTKAASS
ncbi:MAG: zinc ribbon domain-containing protein [Firmicutes bacterium]|nr:zinc ribbon domain-containing protein [Bacillota bacterium]MCL5039582.1 zinc ribbon domain-containing protein [Bacillota bacterium]